MSTVWHDAEARNEGLPDVVEVVGDGPGPTVAVLGGVHGDELEGVLAARSVVRMLVPGNLRGTVRVAAPAHPAAWEADSRTNPLDGLNLARVFPGDSDGSPTERVAAHLTARVVIGADLLIDLHSAGRGFDMPLLVGYHAGGGPVCDRQGELAAIFGAPFLWQHPHRSSGRSLSAAAAQGIPSFYVEGRGGGRVRRRDFDCYVQGVLRVLHHLSMVDPHPDDALTAEPVAVYGDGDTDGGVQAEAAGFLITAAEVGEQVRAGQALALVVDENGAVRWTVRSPKDGFVMLLRRTARVAVGDTLTIVAAAVES